MVFPTPANREVVIRKPGKQETRVCVLSFAWHALSPCIEGALKQSRLTKAHAFNSGQVQHQLAENHRAHQAESSRESSRSSL